MTVVLRVYLLATLVVGSFGHEPSHQGLSHASKLIDLSTWSRQQLDTAVSRLDIISGHGESLAGKPTLECLLSRRFAHVFRIADCGINATFPAKHKGVNTDRWDESELYPLCLWVYHLGVRPGAQPDPHEQARCRRRLLRQVQFRNMLQERSDGYKAHYLEVNWRYDMSNYFAIWPHEAYAYKAHIHAASLCEQWSQKLGTGTHSNNELCVVVTDDASWVTAMDGGKLERSLRRVVDPVAAAVPLRRRILNTIPNPASTSHTAAVPGNTSVSKTMTLFRSLPHPSSPATPVPPAPPKPPSHPEPPLFNVSKFSLGEPGLQGLPWRHCHSRPVRGTAAAVSCRLYHNYKMWMHDLQHGLHRMEIVGSVHGDAASNGAAPNDSPNVAHGSDSSWHVLSLPSSCAGWAIESDTGDISDGLDIVDAHEFEGAPKPSPPPSRRGIPGCILAFSTAGARLIGDLAAITASVANTSSALLPITNVPFYAKLHQLARQQLLRLAVATPALSTSRPSASAPHPPQAPGRSKERRFLMFTSSGDQGVWKQWVTPDRNFDLVVAYYGALSIDDPRVTAGCDDGDKPEYVFRAHGSKHQNLHRLHALHPNLLATYDVVAVWDDDLVISGDQVSALFMRFASLSSPPGSPDGVWVGQPSLKNGSIVDYIVLKHDPALLLTYTSFVEVNAGMYRSDKLVEVLDNQMYTGELLGWGVDHAMLAILGPKLRDRYVVMHDFQVLNPPGESKPRGREILKLAGQIARMHQWIKYMERFKIEPELVVAYKCIPVDPNLPTDQLPNYCPEHPAYQAPMRAPNTPPRAPTAPPKPPAPPSPAESPPSPPTPPSPQPSPSQQPQLAI